MQTRAFGAEIELVPGTRDEVAAEAVRQSASIPYASHNWHPMFLQGTKTAAYEMWEMLGFTAPDNVVLVAGAGSNILGCDIAFTELNARANHKRRYPCECHLFQINRGEHLDIRTISRATGF